jgi:hypothetical protein
MTGGALERNEPVSAAGAAPGEPRVAGLGQRHDAGASAFGAGMITATGFGAAAGVSCGEVGSEATGSGWEGA